MPLTPQVVNAVLGSVLRKQVYVSLHHGPPGDSGDHELVGEGYRRQPVSFHRQGSVWVNADVVAFPKLPGRTVRYVGLFDNREDGNFLWHRSLETVQNANSGDTGVFEAGDLQLGITAR